MNKYWIRISGRSASRSSRDHPHHSESIIAGGWKEGVHQLELGPFFLCDILHLRKYPIKYRIGNRKNCTLKYLTCTSFF
jgi:hypothetical protein